MVHGSRLTITVHGHSYGSRSNSSVIGQGQRSRSHTSSARPILLVGVRNFTILMQPYGKETSHMYTLSNKSPSAWNFLSLEPEVTCGTVAIIIRVILLSPYLRIRDVSPSSIHYNQSHRVCINRRQQYICL